MAALSTGSPAALISRAARSPSLWACVFSPPHLSMVRAVGASGCCWRVSSFRKPERPRDWRAAFDRRSARGAARDHLAAHRGVDCCQHRLCLLRTNQRPPRTFVAAKPHGSAYLRRRRDARAHGSGSQHAGRHAPSVRPLTILNARRPRLDRRRGIRREIGFSLRVMNQRPAAPSAPF